MEGEGGREIKRMREEEDREGGRGREEEKESSRGKRGRQKQPVL